MVFATAALIIVSLTILAATVAQIGHGYLAGRQMVRVQQMAAMLATSCRDAFIAGRVETVQQLTSEIAGQSGVVLIRFEDADGIAIVSFEPSQSELVECLPEQELEKSSAIRAGDEHFFASAAPIAGATPDADPIGRVVVVIDSTELAGHQAEIVDSLLAAGGTSLLIALPFTLLVVRASLQPVKRLSEATRRVVAGDLDAWVDVESGDVLGELAKAFNEMVESIRAHRRELTTANERLEQANRDLELKVARRTKQLEAANDRLQSEIAEKEDFVRAVSHDLNAPLRNIGGIITLLLQKKSSALPVDVVDRLERVRSNVEIEAELINELLELSRIKTRREKMEEFELESLMLELRGMFENDLRTRGIELVIDTSLPRLFAEKARMRQVFQNLIDNAIKYMGDGPRREIHIGAAVGPGEVEFYVRDTGSGIDPQDIDKVFFVFRRGRSETAQRVAGKGVGLASVKSIIETYSGRIWVESQPGQGTTFRFTINGQHLAASRGIFERGSKAA